MGYLYDPVYGGACILCDVFKCTLNKVQMAMSWMVQGLFALPWMTFRAEIMGFWTEDRMMRSRRAGLWSD